MGRHRGRCRLGGACRGAFPLYAGGAVPVAVAEGDFAQQFFVADCGIAIAAAVTNG